MAKALVAVVLATLLVASLAADTGRSLKQVKYDCDGAKEIAKVNNACKLLCDCAASLRKTATDKEKKDCMDQCSKCEGAAKSCKPGSGLPDACKQGQGVKEVDQCINTFLKSRQGSGR